MSRRALLYFLAVAVLWGTPYFFIKIAVAGVAPAVVSFTRLTLAALILVPIAWRRGVIRPVLRHWPWLIALGAGYMALPLTLIPIAELQVSSSLTAIVIAAVPLMVTILVLPWERPTRLELLGLVIGYAGVAALAGFDLRGSTGALVGVGLLIIVTLSYAWGPILIRRRLQGLDSLGLTSVALVVAAAVLVVPAFLTRPTARPSTQVVLALVGLGVLCTALTYTLFFALIREVGPQQASLVTYINPMVAVLLGVAVLHETLTFASIAAMVLILAGSWMAARARQERQRRLSVAAAAPS